MRQVEVALLAAGVPVCVPIPAASFHLDMRTARLELQLPQASWKWRERCAAAAVAVRSFASRRRHQSASEQCAV